VARRDSNYDETGGEVKQKLMEIGRIVTKNEGRLGDAEIGRPEPLDEEGGSEWPIDPRTARFGGLPGNHGLWTRILVEK
jgi:hypothetical protein